MKVTRLIEILIIVLFFIVAYFSVQENLNRRRYEMLPSENLIFESDNNDEKILIIIKQETVDNPKSKVDIRIKKDDKSLSHFDTYVYTEGKQIKKENFIIEYYEDFIKIKILDRKKNITSVFRVYLTAQNLDVNTNSDAKESK